MYVFIYQYSTSLLLIGILQIKHSNMREVTLVNVSKNLTGKYRCEISADAPSFHTVIKTAEMSVVGEYIN